MHPRTLTTTVALVVLPIFGCRTTAPIHAWTPPRLHSAVGCTVVLATITGDPSQAARLTEAISANRPPELSRAVHLVRQAELQRHTDIQLASTAPNVPSDLALVAAAREQGLEYLLIGEILESRGGSPAPRRPDAGPLPAEVAELAAGITSSQPERGDASAKRSSPRIGSERLTVSWRLLDVGEARVVGGMPVTVSTQSAAVLHPDLAAFSGDTESLLATAAARETWKLLIPSIRRHSVVLAEPYLMPGSSAVRRGNEHATAIRWAEAERVWQEVLERHPGNHAALHNLAIAAAARQDFGRAKELAQQALRMHSSKDYERTVVWIEGRQREAVEAFGLPQPEEGWLFAPD